ncbi:MAG: hypothetical protein IAG10_35540 [Planctomycetaceae bacterium]|nr:hypothetical protein [Planctomycetaceae bacterium]
MPVARMNEMQQEGRTLTTTAPELTAPVVSMGAWLKVAVALAFLLLVSITHGRSLRGEFILDDTGAIRDNPSIRSLSSLPDVLLKGRFTSVVGRPLLNLSLAVNYACGQLNPVGYHLFNYCVHTANAVLLFCLLSRIFLMFARTRSAASLLALSVSGLWCVHPLTINGVSYVVQRAESMASFFYLVVLWAFVKGTQTARTRWFFVSVAAGWLGSLTKEIIATVPLTLIALDVLVVTRDWRQAVHRHWRVYLGSMSCWIPLAICMYSSQNRERTVGYGMGIALWDHVQTQVWAAARYLQLMVWPDPLIFDYGALYVMSDLQQVLMATILVGAFLIILSWRLARRSVMAFPGLAICLILAPSSVVPIVTQTVAEHRMYLASACGITEIVLVIFLACSRVRPSGVAETKWNRLVIGVVVTPILLTFCILTTQRTLVLRTRQSIWTDTARKQPTNQRALFGAAYAIGIKNGDLTEAIRLCNQAIAIKGPFTRHALEVRGGLHAKLGKKEQAVDDFSRAIALEPNLIDNLHERASLLCELGRYHEALKDLDEARRIDPANVTTDGVLGTVYAACGERARALECFDRLLAKEPNHVAARHHRVSIYVQLNRWDDASQEIHRLQQEGRRIDQQLVNEVDRHFTQR